MARLNGITIESRINAISVDANHLSFWAAQESTREAKRLNTAAKSVVGLCTEAAECIDLEDIDGAMNAVNRIAHIVNHMAEDVRTRIAMLNHTTSRFMHDVNDLTFYALDGFDCDWDSVLF